MSLLSCYQNILETSSVTLAQGAVNASYPLYRLWDRDIGRMFEAAAAATIEVRIDQGAVPAGVDRLFIPGGHNLSGVALDLQHSDDDVTYTSIGAWAQADANLIVKSFTTAAHRYWKFIAANPAFAPQMAELFLTSTYTWEKLPGRPGGPFEDVFNVKSDVTASGLDRFLIFGNSKRQRIYKVVNAGAAQQANALALNAVWSGAMPFWLYDHEGNWIFGKLAKPLNLKETGAGKFEFDFNFLEVLG